MMSEAGGNRAINRAKILPALVLEPAEGRQAQGTRPTCS